jgi:hypothetical protein
MQDRPDAALGVHRLTVRVHACWPLHARQMALEAILGERHGRGCGAAECGKVALSPTQVQRGRYRWRRGVAAAFRASSTNGATIRVMVGNRLEGTWSACMGSEFAFAYWGMQNCTLPWAADADVVWPHGGRRRRPHNARRFMRMYSGHKTTTPQRNRGGSTGCRAAVLLSKAEYDSAPLADYHTADWVMPLPALWIVVLAGHDVKVYVLLIGPVEAAASVVFPVSCRRGRRSRRRWRRRAYTSTRALQIQVVIARDCAKL